MHILSMADLPIKGKRILMRVDFNVPVDDRGNVTDDTRITAVIPSIKYILEKGGCVILMSHFGRPKGSFSKEFSLVPVAEYLEKLIGIKIKFASDCIGSEAKRLAEALRPGEVLLLENLRFHQAEEHPDKDPEFAKQLAGLGDCYINEAFGACHRTHASVVDIVRYFPGAAAAGFLLQKEIRFLSETLTDPKRPFYAIIGGAKISSKLGVLKALLGKVDALFIGGGMAYTFYRAEGIEIGDSLFEKDLIPEAAEILQTAKSKGVPLFLPIDNVIADKISPEASIRTVPVAAGIPKGESGADIGPETIELFTEKLQNAKTILWNGPLGVFEIEAFSKGTKAIAEAITKTPAVTIVGGGDSIAAIRATGYADKITHISTGGGATLEYLEYGTLPGIDALANSDRG